MVEGEQSVNFARKQKLRKLRIGNFSILKVYLLCAKPNAKANFFLLSVAAQYEHYIGFPKNPSVCDIYRFHVGFRSV